MTGSLRQIAHALGGEIVGRQVLCPGPGHSKHDASLSVRLDPQAPGGFVVHSFCGDDFAACRDHVRERLGLSNDRKPQATPPRAPSRSPAPAADDETRRKTFAAAIVRDLVPVRGSPGETYLRTERGIDTDALADVLERVDAIGWHPHVTFNEPGHALHGRKLGCIVGVMTDPVTAEPTGAVSRTYLHQGRKVGKARTLSSPAGLVRLSRDEDVLEGLHLAEGLETALDAMAKGFRPIWSTGSKALMAKFPLLAGIECLTLFADHDPNGAGLRAAREAEARWLEAGRETHVYQREITGDFNDAFREAKR